MPRQSKECSQADDQEPVVREFSELGPSVPDAVDGEPKNDRDQQGRFAKGNRLSTGNPHARHCARMLEMFRNAITDDEMYQLCRVLFEKASKGDVAALKMIWQYKVGKPLPAPNPDLIERDEWNNYQTDVMSLDEVKQVLAGLPSSVGNAVVSTTRPEITKAFSSYLLEQLLRSVNAVPEGTQEAHVESRDKAKPESAGAPCPVSNSDFGPTDGDTAVAAASPVTHHAPPATPPTRSTIHDPRPTTTTPTVSNGKSTKKKSVRTQWIEPIARKIKGRKVPA